MSSKDHVLALLSAVVALALLAGFVLTSTPVTVTVDGYAVAVQTHRHTVGDLLAELGFTPTAADRVDPSPDTLLHAGRVITITRARNVRLIVDGRSDDLITHAETPATVLSEAGVTVRPRDRVLVNGNVVDINAHWQSSGAAHTGAAAELASFLRLAMPLATAGQPAIAVAQPPPAMTIVVRRAVPISIVQDGAASTVMTAAGSIGEALFAEGIYIYASDIVTPALNAAVASGAQISIQRAVPVTVVADGRTISTRTQAKTITDLLMSEGIPAQGKDFTNPGLQTAVSAGLVVKLTRVREATITESEGIAFTTVHQPNPNIDLDQQQIVTHGKAGVRKRTVRVVYEDGKEVQRVVDREWVDEPPVTQVIAYGTRVVIRTAMMPDGPIEYWREIRTWATFYTPIHSGTPLDAPWFGITFTGKRATKGVIAVDPRAIPLHTNIYVPGYGFGAAEDTGNLVQGMVIDLCYDDDDSHPERWQWARWTTTYLLTPVPANIPYVLPDYPKERR